MSLKKISRHPVWSNVIAQLIAGTVQFFTVDAGFRVVVLLAGIGMIALREKGQTPNPPAWLSYTSDTFYGLKCAWAYEGRERPELHLRAALCQRCDYQVHPDSDSDYDSKVRFHCDNCGHTVNVEGQSWNSLKSVVIRLAQQKLRTHTFPRAERPSAA